MASSVSSQQPQGLPSISTLTDNLPPTSQQVSPAQQSHTNEPPRDSGTWPQPGVNSKHSSAASGLQLHTLLNPDESPSNRNSIPTTPLSARLSAASALPSINQGFSDGSNRGSTEYPQAGNLDSRRSSVDSRMHQGLSNLYINNPASPYESANGSQVSLAASLRRPNGGPMSPLGGRSSVRSNQPPRQAPPIMPIGRMTGGPNPTAANPTQGHAWAFPDQPIPEEGRTSDSGDSSIGGSRANSYAASSIRSSVFSTDSQMPIGQRRFDDEDLPTHHHSMQHRTVSGLQGDKTSPGVGNYSRTPELRVSHKLAERKRRSEMKDLFEELNKAVPSNGGTKASKWEILTKAIDHIKATQHSERSMHNEMQRLQRDADYAREAHKENDMLKTEISVMHQHLRRLDGAAPHVYGHFTSQLQNAPQQSQPSAAGSSGISLPPLNSAGPQSGYANGVTGHAPAGAMQGVEYGPGYAR